LRKGTHANGRLQSAYDKYGENALSFEKLIICSIDDLLMYEQRTIDVLKPEYNICPVAGSTLGTRQSPETIAKRVAKNTGKKRPLEAIIATAVANTGKKRSDETKARLSIIRRRRVTKPETCTRCAIAQTGRQHSEATKLKMSESAKAVQTERVRVRNEEIAGGAIPDGYKPCVKCREVKLTSEFNKNVARIDGSQSECRQCQHTARRMPVARRT